MIIFHNFYYQMKATNFFVSLAFIVITIYGFQLSPVCQLCHSIAQIVQHSFPKHPSTEIIQKISQIYCIRQHTYTPHVCKGAIKEMTPIILNSAWKHYSNPHSVCHKIKLCPKQYSVRPLNQDIEKILQNKPKGKQWQQPTKKKILKIMHISDLHPDLYYTVGAPSICSEPVCCRSNVTIMLPFNQILKNMQSGQVLQAQQIDSDSPAGYWGSVAHCDLPFQTFELFLKQLQKLDLDLILWTGDNTPHDIWQQTQSYNINYSLILTERIKKRTNATILPCLGNHESWPVNVYDFKGDREKVLLEGLGQAWKSWLTDQAYNSFIKNGYYAMTFQRLNNLKVIALNTQAGNDKNWFLLDNPTDPGLQLQWLVKQLQQSQRNGQFVYIIGHIPPKTSLNEWAMRFNAIVDRYSYNIRCGFFGHSHIDHVGFIPNLKQSGKISNYYLHSPSITTASNKDPQYRILQIDYDTLQVLDYHQYILRLQKNPKKQDNPKFQHFYSFLEAYNLTDLTVQGGMKQFKDKLQKDQNTQIKYTYLMYGGLKQGTHGRSVFCDTMTAPQLKSQCMGKERKQTLFQKVSGVWKDLKHKELNLGNE